MATKTQIARWISNTCFVVGVGLTGWAGYVALIPNRIELFVSEPDALLNWVVGEARRIPVAAVNRTATRIRLVGTNAC